MMDIPKTSSQKSSSHNQDASGADKAGDTTDMLVSHRAEIFRSKLIEDFHLLDTMDDKGKIEAPKYYSKDLTDPEYLDRILKENPNGLVRFQVYSTKDKIVLTRNDRRRNRVVNKNSKNPPIDMWAHWVVESTWFQNCILFLILMNTIVLGVQSEMGDMWSQDNQVLATILDVCDYGTLFVFVLEILLKWLDDFVIFWKNGWNIFDFLVTFLSFIPEIINFSSGDFGKVKSDDIATNDLTVIANNLRVFRIFRSLKMVSRFRQVRLIALAVAKAFQAMVFILILLMIFAYIFAIAGIIFFDQHSHSPRKDLKYTGSFATIQSCLITLFQLLTLDHWHDIYKDVTKVVNPWFAGLYIILWICIGSFVFRNIFVGIMVNNFQSIRTDLFSEIEEIEELKQQNVKIEKLNEELIRQDQILKGQRESNRKLTTESQMKLDNIAKSLEAVNELKPGDAEGIPAVVVMDEDDDAISRGKADLLQQMFHEKRMLSQQSTARPGVSAFGSDFGHMRQQFSQQMLEATSSSTSWQDTVIDNLDTLSKNPIETMWPQDTLFDYFLLMESLQENLVDRQELSKLTMQALLNIHDN